LAFDVKSAEERVRLGLGSVAEVAVEIAKGLGASKVGVGDADAGELEKAFEEL
jgi:threonine dehydrogenase-like Zn-dependent dehydrogenase